jgi:hypothetical protein
MGSGRWSTDVYEEMEKERARRGDSAFAHYDRAVKTGKLEVHETLNLYGVAMRESRDSAEHPESNAIMVMLDVTGSMNSIPRRVQEKLPQLLGLLLYKNYIAHPQILFGAVGDATCDKVPLQVGQFESDNRMDAHLQNLILEGGGGGQMTESYELALYVAARHTAIDCYEKRGKRGYLFLIGDELAYPNVKEKEVKRLIGDGLKGDLPLAAIAREAKQKYNVFYIIPAGASHSADPKLLQFWRDLLGGENIILLDNPDDVSETIALTIGMAEGTIGLDDGIADLRAVGASAEALSTVSKALATLPGARGGGRAVVKGELDDAGGSGGTSKRL